MGDETYSTPEETREGKAARKHRHKLDREAIDRLLYELRPEDATQQLFTWAEIKEWSLRRRRKPNG